MKRLLFILFLFAFKSYSQTTIQQQKGGSTQLNTLLPSQSGNNGKVLQTNGTNTLWATSGSGGGVDTLYQQDDSLMYIIDGTPHLAFELPDSLIMTRGALQVELDLLTNHQTLFIDTADASKDGILLKEDYAAFANKMDTLILTTTGTGAATWNPATNTINIPTPAGGGVATGVAATGGLSITSDGESTINDNTAEIVIGGFPNKPLRFIVNNSEKMKIMPTTGNIMLQNGGTYTDISSSILTLTSTTKAFTLTRMTQAQRNAIASPVAGMMIYQTDATPGLRVYNGTNWMRFTETID